MVKKRWLGKRTIVFSTTVLSNMFAKVIPTTNVSFFQEFVLEWYICVISQTI